MSDKKSKLTTQLHDARETLLVERSDIIRRVQELQAELDMNSSRIEATDTVMLLFNPEHVSLDIRSDVAAAPMLTVGRRTLELASSAADVSATQPAPSKAERKTVAKTKAATKGKKSLSKKKLTVEEQIAAIDAALGAKAERSPESQAISGYFQKSGRNDTILKILESKDEPVNAATVARDYKALYPLPEDNSTMRNLHSSKVSSALHYLKARGQAVRIADERGDGKAGVNVRWELSKSYRAELRRAKSGGRPKTISPFPVASEQDDGDVRIAVGAR